MAGMNTPSKQITIAALGDSITQAVEVEEAQRWPALLEVALSNQIPDCDLQVVNCGIGGNTSREGLARMEEVLSHQPNFVLVEFGGNDTTDDAERHVSREEFARNLQAMKQQIESGGATMVLLTFPPVINDWSEEHTKPHHQSHGGGDGHVERYRQLTRDFASENGLHLIDIDRALREAAKESGWQKYLQPDGVHITESGNEIISEAVCKSLVESGLLTR